MAAVPSASASPLSSAMSRHISIGSGDAREIAESRTAEKPGAHWARGEFIDQRKRSHAEGGHGSEHTVVFMRIEPHHARTAGLPERFQCAPQHPASFQRQRRQHHMRPSNNSPAAA